MARIPTANIGDTGGASGRINAPNPGAIPRPLQTGRVSVVTRGPSVFARPSGVMQDPNAMTAHLRGEERAAGIRSQAASQLMSIGQHVSEFAIRAQEARNTADIATADVALKGAFEEYRSTLGPDPKVWLPEWQERRKELMRDLLDRDDLAPAVRRKIEMNAKAYAAETDLAIKLMGDKRQVSYSKARTEEAYISMRNLGDDAAAAELLEANVQLGIHTPEEAFRLKKQSDRERTRADIMREAEIDPHGLLERLSAKTEGAPTTPTIRGSYDVTADNLTPHLGDALKPHAQDFIDAGKAYGLDPRFLAAVAKVETGDGTSNAFRNKKNAMGISDAQGPIAVGDVRESIMRQAKTLASESGPYAGKSTIEEIGAVYAPPGAGNDPNRTNHTWPAQVRKFYAEMGGTGGEGFQHYPDLSPMDRQRWISIASAAAVERESSEATEIRDLIESDGFPSMDDLNDALYSSSLNEQTQEALRKQFMAGPIDWQQMTALKDALISYDYDEDTTGRNYHEIQKAIALSAPSYARADLNAILDAKSNPGSMLSRGVDVIDNWFENSGRVYLEPGPRLAKAQIGAYQRFKNWMDSNPDASFKEVHAEALEIAKITSRAGLDATAAPSGGTGSLMAVETKEQVIQFLQGRDGVDLTGFPLTDEEVKAAAEKAKADEERRRDLSTPYYPDIPVGF